MSQVRGSAGLRQISSVRLERSTRSTFVKVPAWIIFGSLSHGAVRAYMVLRDEAFARRSGTIGMSYAVLGERLGVSDRQARRYVEELVHFGGVQLVERRRGASNRYKVLEEGGPLRDVSVKHQGDRYDRQLRTDLAQSTDADVRLLIEIEEEEPDLPPQNPGESKAAYAKRLSEEVYS